MAPVREMKDESVGAVKEMLAELVREKELLVARLNDLHKHIEGDQNLTSRVLRQAEWMDEKDRTVARLSKVAASLWDLLEDDPRGGMAGEPSLGSSHTCPQFWSQDLSDAQTQEGGDSVGARPSPGSFKSLFCASPSSQREEGSFKTQGSFKTFFSKDQAEADTKPPSKPASSLHRTRRRSVVMELVTVFRSGYNSGIVRIAS
ncbi:hypothetical protein T484DRAFT_1981017 [Baffinella frigidus]|nr:hypothetical protein T484DRAFT_1981017 [Cryptophyta sp. CCMP2293]